MWTEIKDDLMKLPLLIKDKELEVYQLRKEIEEKELSKKTIEELIWLDVFNTVNPDKTRTYTNDKLRLAEQKKRLAQGQDYQKNVEDLKELKKKIIPEEINLSYLKRKFRAVESLTRM